MIRDVNLQWTENILIFLAKILSELDLAAFLIYCDSANVFLIAVTIKIREKYSFMVTLNHKNTGGPKKILAPPYLTIGITIV